MKVQRVRPPNTDQIRWIVLDDEFVPIQPICSYLTFLDDLDRSPNTIRSTAHHLKLFSEYLRDEHLCSRTEMNVARLAAFIPWLRRSETEVISIESKPARRTNATIDQNSRRCPQLLPVSHAPGYRCGVSLVSVVHAKPAAIQAISAWYCESETRAAESRCGQARAETSRKTLTIEQVEALIEACSHVRDKFLLTLLFPSG